MKQTETTTKNRKEPSVFTVQRVHLVPLGTISTPVLAQVEVRVHDAIRISVNVVNGRTGIFAAIPERRTIAGRHEPVFTCVNNQVRHHLDGVVLTAYNDALLRQGVRVPDALQ